MNRRTGERRVLHYETMSVVAAAQAWCSSDGGDSEADALMRAVVTYETAEAALPKADAS